MNLRKGQSAIEYILLAACFIAFLIVFLSPSGPMKNTIELNINRSVNQIGVMVNANGFTPPPPANCAQYSSNQAACCSQGQCIWRRYYHLGAVTTSCISKNLASSSCDSYNLNSCCCVQEVGYSGTQVVPTCVQ